MPKERTFNNTCPANTVSELYSTYKDGELTFNVKNLSTDVIYNVVLQTRIGDEYGEEFVISSINELKNGLNTVKFDLPKILYCNPDIWGLCIDFFADEATEFIISNSKESDPNEVFNTQDKPIEDIMEEVSPNTTASIEVADEDTAIKAEVFEAAKDKNVTLELTLSIEPWQETDSGGILGINPVNSDDRSMLEYLTSAEELWADENGWISIEKDDSSVTFVISREGIESPGDGGLGFETYNLIVTSAVLKPSEKQKALKIHDFYKERNAPYSVCDNDKGKTVTLELDEYRVRQEGEFESQSIPKSAFYVFDGDVKVTVTLEDLEDNNNDDRSIYVFNNGFCYSLIQNDILVPLKTDGVYQFVSYDDHCIRFDKNCRQLIIIIPQHAKEKMGNGIFFQCVNVRTGKVCLEVYNGENNIFA